MRNFAVFKPRLAWPGRVFLFTIFIFMKVLQPASLFDFLLLKVDTASKTGVKSMIKQGKVTVDGVVALKADMVLKTGQIVEISRKGNITPTIKRRTKELEFDILYQDEHFIAVFKPANVLAVSTTRTQNKDIYSLTRVFMAQQDPPTGLYYVHGLDRSVSGIMIFGKTEKARTALKGMWPNVIRKYTCLVEGKPFVEEGVIDNALQPNRKGKNQVVETESVTHYKVMKLYPSLTLMSVEPKHEQKNQIKKHLAAIDCYIVGDRERQSVATLMKRMAIHFGHLQFEHPFTKQQIKITCPIPKEMLFLAKKTKAEAPVATDAKKRK